ncbi:hypothetical protein AVEN_264075-1 [Araneus ventricosus]|uniref:Uncharacterized protein n=1 Tax=Araneus ventricosus TaxID=182803 RepID=A0A4Y2X110_ARAVE|nr:hypothetical protein AVEN_196246-1 [Araneus ventricosus]GBO41804.1 hypothetical protein AVEN_226950-1 [Araneus ventricosus]GBO41805.1 hypothetical protein AVEN_231102-1 [Araneus ventricosus]GBO41807.1 hypothetical protein AVEN_264075-1 [Araneus ventricosus]
MEHILKSLSSSDQYKDIEYKRFETKNAIINQDSLTSQMRATFPNVAHACDKINVSERSAEILINAALKDMGIISKEDSSKVVYRSKIRWERIKTRKDLKRKKLVKTLFIGV